MYRLCGSQRQGAFIPLHLDDRPWRCAALHVDRALAPVAGAGGRSFSGIVVSQPVLGNSFRGVGPALYAEQGGMYYLHAYLALGVMACGAAWGWQYGRK